MKKRYLTFLFILLLIAITACTQPIADDSVMDDSMMDGSMDEDKVIFVMTGENFKFVMEGVDNPDIVVNEGDLVRIEFTSTSGYHDWVVDEMGEATIRVDSGESAFVEFVADKKGEFEYYCSVGKHREKGMKGKFIVN